MSIRVDTIETGKRAKPLRKCKACGCKILSISYCGPCADERREQQRQRSYAAKKLARHSEQAPTAQSKANPAGGVSVTSWSPNT